MRKTRLEIIDETVAFGYTSTHRGKTVGGHCFYLHPDTNVPCAVGRCCIAPLPEWEGPWTQLSIGNRQLDYETREELLKPEYRAQGTYFWQEIQHLHDNDENWTDSGLSAVGTQRVIHLREKWK